MKAEDERKLAEKREERLTQQMRSKRKVLGNPTSPARDDLKPRPAWRPGS